MVHTGCQTCRSVFRIADRTILFPLCVTPTCVCLVFAYRYTEYTPMCPCAEAYFLGRSRVNVWDHYDLIFTDGGSPFLLHLDSNMTLFFRPNIYFTCLHHHHCSSTTLFPYYTAPMLYSAHTLRLFSPILFANSAACTTTTWLIMGS